jgi:CheY-like chemotaxis protein
VPDLVITDLRMPNMNGFELLSVIRQRFPQLPTVVISGEFLACQIDQGMLADAFFQKGSYSIPEFLGKISDLLARPASTLRSAGTNVTNVWTPVGDEPVMLTCTECLRSFPIETGDGAPPYPKHVDCIFCGANLQVQLVAIGVSGAAD